MSHSTSTACIYVARRCARCSLSVFVLFRSRHAEKPLRNEATCQDRPLASASAAAWTLIRIAPSPPHSNSPFLPNPHVVSAGPPQRPSDHRSARAERASAGVGTCPLRCVFPVSSGILCVLNAYRGGEHVLPRVLERVRRYEHRAHCSGGLWSQDSAAARIESPILSGCAIRNKRRGEDRRIATSRDDSALTHAALRPCCG